MISTKKIIYKITDSIESIKTSIAAITIVHGLMKINNVWEEGTFYIKINGVWIEPTTCYVKINGSWTEMT